MEGQPVWQTFYFVSWKDGESDRHLVGRSQFDRPLISCPFGRTAGLTAVSSCILLEGQSVWQTFHLVFFQKDSWFNRHLILCPAGQLVWQTFFLVSFWKDTQFDRHFTLCPSGRTPGLTDILSHALLEGHPVGQTFYLVSLLEGQPVGQTSYLMSFCKDTQFERHFFSCPSARTPSLTDILFCVLVEGQTVWQTFYLSIWQDIWRANSCRNEKQSLF